MRAGGLTLLVAIAFLASFAWEMTQVPLFANLAGRSFLAHASTCVAATLGDQLILAATYAVAALLARDGRWIFHPRAAPIAAWIVLGLAVTVALERSAVASGRWQYSVSMPTVAGVGLAPLAQWIVVPLLLVAVARAASSRAPRA